MPILQNVNRPADRQFCFCVIVAGDVYTIVMLVKSENKNTKSTFKYTFLYENILLSCYQVIRKTFIFLAIFNLS